MPTIPTAAQSEILDALDVGIVVQDSESRVLYANPAAAHLLGITVAEAVTRDSRDARWQITRPDGSPFEASALPVFEALRTGLPVRGVILGVRRPSGHHTWLSVNAVPRRGALEVVDHVVVTLTDITAEMTLTREMQSQVVTLDETARMQTTELAQAKRDLESSENTYRSVLRAMAEGVALHATTGAILFTNPSAEQILGLSLAQMQGRHPVDPSWRLTDSRGRPLPPAAIPSEITRLTGQPQRNVVLGVDRNESDRAWLSVNTDPIGEPGTDGYWMVVATFTDITSERRALAAVEAGRDRLFRLTEALPGAVLEIVMPRAGNPTIQYASAPIESLTGVSAVAAVEHPEQLWARVYGADFARLTSALREAADHQHSVDLELRIASPQGGSRDTRLRSGPPTRVDGGALFRAIVLDVTEQRQLERTLRETQRREGMGLLAAGIAHNFNNMLAAILPSLELLRTEVGDALRADVDDAYQATLAASELVRQLMGLTRRDHTVAPEPVDLASLADDVARLCRRTFDRRIDVVLTGNTVPCIVQGRRAELQQVLLNLCLNARDALEQAADPRLSLSLKHSGDSVVLEVADNGAGMSPDVQARIGEPFFTTKAPGKGTGLGIATVIGILRDADATITWSSVLGAGTTFEARFPRVEAVRRTTPTGLQVLEASPRRGVALVVDDEALVRRSVVRTLERIGFETHAAEGGIVALGLLRETPDIGLVLIDQNMPGMSGPELYTLIRATWPKLPVIVISGFDTAAIAPGPHTALLAKPFREAQLRETIATLLP